MIGQKYDLSPQMIFVKMQVQRGSNTTHSGTKRGYGRMNIAQICKDKGIRLEDALSRLENKGIEATGESTLRDLGKSYNKSPIDIVKIIETSAKYN